MNKDNPSQAPRKITGWVLKTNPKKQTTEIDMVVLLQLQLFMRHFSNSCTSSLKKQKGIEDDGTEGWLGFYKSSGTEYSKSNIWENNHPLHLHNNQFRSWKKLYKKKQKQKTQKISPELHKVTS